MNAKYFAVSDSDHSLRSLAGLELVVGVIRKGPLRFYGFFSYTACLSHLAYEVMRNISPLFNYNSMIVK
jgi:hypothetical protein